MSLKPDTFGHAADYHATRAELLAAASKQADQWRSALCQSGHATRAMDADGCNVLTRELAANQDGGPVPTSAVVEFCLVCGAVEWITPPEAQTGPAAMRRFMRERAAGVSADLPGLPGVPASIGPIRCPECEQLGAEVRHVRSLAGQLVIRDYDDADCPATGTVLAAIGDAWLQVMWPGATEPTVEPFDGLTPAPDQDASYEAQLTCRACGAALTLDADAYAAGLTVGVLVERTSQTP